MPNALLSQAITAMTWSYVGVAAYVLLQVTANIAYARLLGPEQFGLFASGMLATGILKVVSDLGLGSALTRAQNLDAMDIRWTFTRLLVAGALAGLVLAACSEALARALNDLRLVWVFRAFSFALVCFPISTTCNALLSRNLDQKRAQFANVIGYGLGYCAMGLVAASLGLGAWSPIIGFFCQLFINGAALFAFARPDLRPAWSSSASTDSIARFGHRVMLTNVSNWLTYSMDNLLVQRLFGTRQFGLYSVAYNVVRTPVDHLVQTVQNVLMPASARVKDDTGRLGRGYIAAVDAVMLLTFPTFATVAAISGTFVDGLYGPRWMGAAAVLAPLALAMPLQALTSVTSSLLWGTGYVGREMRVQWASTVLLLAAIVVCAQWSFVAMAWGVLGVYLVRCLLTVHLLLEIVGLRVAQLARAARGGACVALVIAGAIWELDLHLTLQRVTSLSRLGIEIPAAALLWAGLLLLGRSRLISTDLRMLLLTVRVQFTQKIREIPARDL